MEKKFSICLVDAKAPLTTLNTPLNLLSLASYLVAKKILKPNQIKIINSNNISSVDQIVNFKPSVIGVSSVTPAFAYAVKLAKTIKKKINVPIIIGGHHITGEPRYLESPFDAGVMGEGEGALVDIVNILLEGKSLTPETLKEVKNVIYRDRSGTLVINPMRSLMRPEEIPPYHWPLLEPEQIVRYEAFYEEGKVQIFKGAQIFSARGCPYQCAFCARQIIWKTGAGFRVLPINQVVHEIEYLYKTYHISHIAIIDDTFAVSKARIRELIEKLKEKKLLGVIKFPWAFARANLIDEEFVSILKELGVMTVFIGIESGSPRILDYLKNGSLKIYHVKNAVKLLGQQQIGMRGGFMLFSPKETKKDLDKTYALAKWFAHQESVYSLGIFPTIPYPGTRLWDDYIIKQNIGIHSIQWKKLRHVVIHPHAPIAGKVFFRNGLSTKQLNGYWRRMYKVLKFADNKTMSASEWTAIRRKEDRLNKTLLFRLEMKHRISRVLADPTRLLTRVFRLYVWKHVFHDVRSMIRF
jgi:anaerobic magnesium-protoporphyrin IX monomethyl ester cyclase